MAVKVYQDKRNAKRDAEWNRMMEPARKQTREIPFMKMNDQQAIGYILGTLIRDGIASWKRHQKDRAIRKQQDLNNATNNLGNGTWTESDLATYHGLPKDFYDRLDNSPSATMAPSDVVPIVDNGNPVSPQKEVTSPVTQVDVNATGLYVNPDNNYDVSPLPKTATERLNDYLKGLGEDYVPYRDIPLGKGWSLW